MPQFLIIAVDFTDENCLERRMAVRSNHLERMKQEKLLGKFIIGGATLKNEQMNGSMLLVEMENAEEVENWVKDDPYTTGKVWDKVTITPFRIAAV